MSVKDYVPLLLIVMAGGVLYSSHILEKGSENISGSKQALAQSVSYVNKGVIRNDIFADPYSVTVNPQVPLSYKSKEDVYAIRRSAVKKSIFSDSGYEPSSQVFGQIVSNKPWYGSNICRDINTRLPQITGPSEESRFINNPTMLVAIEFPFLYTDNRSFCTSLVNQMMPKPIMYSKSRNMISVNTKLKTKAERYT